jgi:hypothetical protein
MSLEVTVRLAILALERPFIYHLHEALDFNIDAFLLSCKLKPFFDKIAYTFVCDGVDLSQVDDVQSLLKNCSVLYLMPQSVHADSAIV